MADWTPEERNDGSVILGWYSAGKQEDIDNGWIEKSDSFTTSRWNDRTPFGNDLIAGPAGVPTDNSFHYFNFEGQSDRYFSHSNAYLLGQPGGVESLTYFVVADVDTFDQGRYFITEGSTQDKSLLVPMQGGSTSGGTVGQDYTFTVRKKDGTYAQQNQPIQDLQWLTGKRIYRTTLSQGKQMALSKTWVGGAVDAVKGTVDTNYQIGETFADFRHNQLPIEEYGWEYTRNYKGTGDRFLVNAIENDTGIVAQTASYRLYEILVVRNCSTSLRELIEAYLAHRHNIVGQLSPDHIGYGAPVQTGDTIDPYYSLVRSYNQFKGPVGQEYSQDLKAPIGLRFTFNENDPPWKFDLGIDAPWDDQYNDTDKSVYWWTSRPPNDYEYNELPGLITPSDNGPLSPNNPFFPYWWRYQMGHDKGLSARPLKSGSTAFWVKPFQGVKQLDGTIDTLRFDDTILHSQNSGLEYMGENDFTIEFSFMMPSNWWGAQYQNQNRVPIFKFGRVKDVNQCHVYESLETENAMINVYVDPPTSTDTGEVYLLLLGESLGDGFNNNYWTEDPQNYQNYSYFRYIVPPGEEFYRHYEVCIQRTSGRLDFYLDGKLIDSGVLQLKPGETELKDVNYDNNVRWLRAEDRVYLDSYYFEPEFAAINGTYNLGNNAYTLKDGLGFCFGARHLIRNGPSPYYWYQGSAVIDNFRYTLGVARYTDDYLPALQVDPPEQPSVTVEPDDWYGYEGQTASFVCQATSIEGTITYQWYDAATNATVPGGTSGTLTLTNVQFVYPYKRYYCVVDNGLALNRSREATLYANPTTITAFSRIPGLPSAPSVLTSNPGLYHMTVPGPLGVPTGTQLQTITASGPLPSPLYPPRIVATLDVKGGGIALGENYGAVLIDAAGNETEVKISSYQATLSARSQNYAQIVIPAAGEYTEAINSAVAFRVSQYQTTNDGLSVQFVMAQVGTLTRTFQRGISSNTCTIRGYSEKFPGDEVGDPIELKGIRQYSTGETGTRVRANLDYLVKPGRRVQYEQEQDFVVGFVNQYVTGNQAYMDVGE